MKDYLDQYLEFLSVSRQSSQHTLRAYSGDILSFFEYAKEFGAIDQLLIRKYLVHLQKEGKSRASIARILASIRSYYKYLLMR
ncbi:MAG: site-specific integrase, partial [Armatimonadota bacterium]